MNANQLKLLYAYLISKARLYMILELKTENTQVIAIFIKSFVLINVQLGSCYYLKDTKIGKSFCIGYSSTYAFVKRNMEEVQPLSWIQQHGSTSTKKLFVILANRKRWHVIYYFLNILEYI